MKAYPRREFLLRVLAACGTPLAAPIVSASAAQTPAAPLADPTARIAATYFGAGADAVRVIGEAYLRQRGVEATRASILEHAAGALQILAAAGNQEAALADLVSAVRRDFQEGRVIELEGWVLSRTEVELCALTLLSAVL
jgi:predicted regulator of Ras-like GTPase activity (Roadblock/LC7/MglB family)